MQEIPPACKTILKLIPIGKITEKEQKRTPSDCFLAILPIG